MIEVAEINICPLISPALNISKADVDPSLMYLSGGLPRNTGRYGQDSNVPDGSFPANSVHCVDAVKISVV
jgi:hypothetical protein